MHVQPRTKKKQVFFFESMFFAKATFEHFPYVFSDALAAILWKKGFLDFTKKSFLMLSYKHTYNLYLLY